MTDWASQQMDGAEVPPSTQERVLMLLKTWHDTEDMGADSNIALETFSSLARGHAIYFAEDSPGAVWEPARAGNISVGDEVRVKFDAYPKAPMHNSRRCRVVAVRYGDIIVNSIDDIDPPIFGAHHSPNALEKRIS